MNIHEPEVARRKMITFMIIRYTLNIIFLTYEIF